jgi:hypothetical protein
MSRKMIPVEESFAAWSKDPKYVEAYAALEDEFSAAAAALEARTDAISAPTEEVRLTESG